MSFLVDLEELRSDNFTKEGSPPREKEQSGNLKKNVKSIKLWWYCFNATLSSSPHLSYATLCSKTAQYVEPGKRNIQSLWGNWADRIQC